MKLPNVKIAVEDSDNTIFLLNILNRVVDNILHVRYFHDKLIAR
jgi:hypothetical protein